MGMYTGLRGKIYLKDEQIEKHLKDCIENQTGNIWGDMSNRFPSFVGLSEFSKMGRSNFIPCGAVCYLGNWKDAYWKIENGVFEFCCSLKNYQDEIETFIEKVLPEIADDWDLEMQYEEWEEPISVTKEHGIDWESVVNEDEYVMEVLSKAKGYY